MQRDVQPSDDAAPLVSVIICVHNGGGFLQDAVESIRRQTYSNLEIVVVDDGSTDGSSDEIGQIDDVRIRIIKQPHQGKSAALNNALGVLKGEYYAIQDADDLSHPKRIERQLRFLEEHPTIAGVFCGHELIIRGIHQAPRSHAMGVEVCRNAVRTMRMPALDPTAMYRLALVKGIRYDTSLLMGQGYDYILRVGERFPLCVIEGCFYSYRLHGQSLTQRNWWQRGKYIQMVCDNTVKRRASNPSSNDTSPDDTVVLDNRPSALATPDNNISAHYIESALDQCRSGSYRGALLTALQSISHSPLRASYYRPFIYTILPDRIRCALRQDQDIAPVEHRKPENEGSSASPYPQIDSPSGAYSSFRPNLLNSVPSGTRRLLSVGCGDGLTEGVLVREGVELVGIEPDPEACRRAIQQGITTIRGKAEEVELSNKERFDCLLYADTLEHMEDPQLVLRRHYEHLDPGGVIVVSVPNYRKYSVLWQLAIRGEIQHTKTGILDKTHRQITTKRTAERWLRELHLIEIRSKYSFSGRKLKILNLLTFGLLAEFLAEQSITSARRPPVQ